MSGVSCGAHFEWEGFDNRLDPWLRIHTAHVETSIEGTAP